jgi:hypothetical protein
MSLRLDTIDDATLEAATSRGLVRRAHRDVAAGVGKIVRYDETEAIVEVDDATVTLRPGGLRKATCTCPAREMCRHVVAAVIQLRGASAAPAPPQPAEEPAATPKPAVVAQTATVASDPVAEMLGLSDADLVKAFGRAALSRAAESFNADARPPTITVSGTACTVELEGQPAVRYVAGEGIGGMVCKAPAAKAKQLRACALLAVRRAHGVVPDREPAAPSTDVADETVGRDALLQSAHQLLIEWTRSGLAAAPVALEDRLFDAAIASRAQGLFRLSAELRRASHDVRRRRERDAAFEAADSLSAAAGCFALIAALRRSPDDPLLCGRAREAYEPIGDLRLVGCGAEVWRTPSGARGATAHFYAPAERRWFTASLARGDGKDPTFVPENALQSEPIWGSTLAALASQTLDLKGASAAPSGRLSLSRETVVRATPFRLTRETFSGWAGAFAAWSELDAFVRRLFSPSLRLAPRSSGHQIVLLPAKVGRPRFDEIAQRLEFTVTDREGRHLELAIDNVPHHQQRLRAAEELLDGPPVDAVFATIALDDDALSVTPYAMLSRNGGAPISLDRVGSNKAAVGWGALIGRRIAERLWRGAAPPPSIRRSTDRLLDAALDQLLGLCELGGQMHDDAANRKLIAVGRRLDDIGLHPLAALLVRVSGTAGPQRAQSILIATHAINVLRRLALRPIC